MRKFSEWRERRECMERGGCRLTPQCTTPHLHCAIWLQPPGHVLLPVKETALALATSWQFNHNISSACFRIFFGISKISLSVVCYDTLSLFWQFRVKIAIISSLMILFAETESALHTGQRQRPTPPNSQNSRTLVVTWRDPPIYYICNREKTIEKSTVCPRCQVTKKLPILWSQTKTHLYWITLDHLP